MSEIKLRIDIKSGTIDIEAGKDSFELVLDKASALLDKFSQIQVEKQSISPNPHSPSEEKTASDAASVEVPVPDVKEKKKKNSGSAKQGNWHMVDNLLDEAGRDSLKSFYSEKAPATQNEQVAVLTVKLKELTKREGFDGNEVYTAFQIVNKKTPGNLGAVFGNMATAGLGSQADKRFRPNFKAEDLVKHDLPQKKGKKVD